MLGQVRRLRHYLGFLIVASADAGPLTLLLFLGSFGCESATAAHLAAFPGNRGFRDAGARVERWVGLSAGSH